MRRAIQVENAEKSLKLCCARECENGRKRKNERNKHEGNGRGSDEKISLKLFYVLEHVSEIY